MRPKHRQISVVIPAHNEAGSIAQLYKEIEFVRKKEKLEIQYVFVNDGSQDNTQKVLASLAKKDHHVLIIHVRTRMGKAHALKVGFDHASHDYIITLDADLQDNPIEIPRFIERLDRGSDLVSGWKKSRKDNLSKTIPSAIFNYVIRSSWHTTLHDINCGFKGYRSDVIREIPLYGNLHRYIPVLALSSGFKVDEIVVDHRPRMHGSSKYGWERLLGGFFDLMTVIYLTRFRAKPLYMFGMVGLSFFTLGLACTAYLMYTKFILEQNIGQRPLLIFAIFFMIIGIQIGVVGLLAEQLTQLSQQIEYRPNIRSITGKTKGKHAS